MEQPASEGLPDHWSLLFGQIAFYSFVMIVLSGVFLTVYYEPSVDQVRYDGPYAPLHGVQMSRALDSTMGITFEVRGGLLMRQLHHWATLIMVAAITLHLLRLFFTAGFRRPRRLNWLVVSGCSSSCWPQASPAPPCGRHGVRHKPRRTRRCPAGRSVHRLRTLGPAVRWVVPVT